MKSCAPCVRIATGTRRVAETVGWLADKLSIVELKRYHMREQMERSDVTARSASNAPGSSRCSRASATISPRSSRRCSWTSRPDAWCRSVYRQFKMYNDPAYRVSRDEGKSVTGAGAPLTILYLDINTEWRGGQRQLLWMGEGLRRHGGRPIFGLRSWSAARGESSRVRDRGDRDRSAHRRVGPMDRAATSSCDQARERLDRACAIRAHNGARRSRIRSARGQGSSSRAA